MTQRKLFVWSLILTLSRLYALALRTIRHRFSFSKYDLIFFIVFLILFFIVIKNKNWRIGCALLTVSAFTEYLASIVSQRSMFGGIFLIVVSILLLFSAFLAFLQLRKKA